MCPHCDQPLAGEDRGLCGTCWATAPPRGGAWCARCGGPADDDEPCLECVQRPPAQRATVVWGEHHGVLRSAILTLKHGGRDDLADPLAMRLAAGVASTEWSADVTLVSWVPSHFVRRLRRRCPAARLLAAGVARRIGAPCRPLLSRKGFGRQTGRSRSRRLQMPRGSFAARTAARQHTVLVVDDVITTGTTMHRAAEALLAAGATTVYCAALAMTPSPRSF